MNDTTNAKSTVTIKKYANRRLYNTATSSYVTLEDLSAMVKEGVEFNVYDAKTSEDITRSVLTQIIVEEEGKSGQQNLLPIGFLRQLISFYGDNMQWMVPKYLDHSMQMLAQNQEQIKNYFQSTFGGMFPFGSTFEEMGKQNMAMFERTMSMFTKMNPSVMSNMPNMATMPNMASMMNMMSSNSSPCDSSSTTTSSTDTSDKSSGSSDSKTGWDASNPMWNLANSFMNACVSNMANATANIANTTTPTASSTTSSSSNASSSNKTSASTSTKSGADTSSSCCADPSSTSCNTMSSKTTTSSTSSNTPSSPATTATTDTSSPSNVTNIAAAINTPMPNVKTATSSTNAADDMQQKIANLQRQLADLAKNRA